MLYRARRSVSDLLCRPHRIAIVDNDVRAEGAHEAEVPLRGSGDDVQAGELCELDRVLPYGTRAARDEDRKRRRRRRRIRDGSFVPGELGELEQIVERHECGEGRDA